MKMFNGELKGFVEFLLRLELSGRQSRMRSRFVKLVTERLQEMEEVRMGLIARYANRDESGQLSVVTDGNSSVYDIPHDKRVLLDTEFNEVQNEEFILGETEERLDMLRAVRDAILDATGPFAGVNADRYDRWCDIIESIN